MSDNVEKRSLELEFKNKGFEQNVGETLKSLNKLNKSLDSSKFAKGLDQFQKIGKKIDLSGITNALSGMEQRFESFAYRLKVNVYDKIISYSKNMVKSLTIDPISTGFTEYGLLMDSIRVIKASTGENVKTIQGYLDELNEYSDRTIYSFSDMTRNIGKFTNAGVSLERATKAIKGIANVAAISGATASNAEHAMYNFSQALSQGYVKLIDWKSIVFANMATVEFKQQLIDTATELGTIEKVGDNLWKTTKNEISATKNFEESLSDQWLTSEVLITTLERYTDETTEIGKKAYAAASEVTDLGRMIGVLRESAQSGWALSWRYIFGDYEEVKSFLTDISKKITSILDSQADSRNEALREWKDLGGRVKLLKIIENIFFSIQSVFKTISIGWDKVFGKIGGRELFDWTKLIEKASEKLKYFFVTSTTDEFGNDMTIWSQNSLKIINISEGIASIFKLLIDLMNELGLASILMFQKPLSKFIPKWMIGLIGILDLTGLLKPFLGTLYDLVTVTSLFGQNLMKSLEENETFKEVMGGFTKIWEPIRSSIENALTSFVTFFSSLLLGENSIENFTAFISGLLSILDPIVSALSTVSGYVYKFFGALFSEISNVSGIKSLGGIFTNVFGVIGNVFGGLKNFITNNPLTDEQISNAAKSVWSSVVNFFTNAWGTITKWLNNVPESMSSFWTSITNGVSSFFTNIDLKERIVALYEKISQWLSNKAPNVGAFFGRLFGTIGTALSNVGTKIWSVITNIFKKIEPFAEKLSPIFKPIVDSITNFFTNIKNEISEKGFFGFLKTFFANVFKSLKEIFHNVKNWFVNGGLNSTIQHIKDSLHKTISNIIEFFSNPFSGKKEPKINIVKSFSNWLTKMLIPSASAEELEVETATKEFLANNNDVYNIYEWLGDQIKKHIESKASDETTQSNSIFASIGMFFTNAKESLSKIFFGSGDFWVNLYGIIKTAFLSIWKIVKLMSIVSFAASMKDVTKNISEFKNGFKQVETTKAKAMKLASTALLIGTIAGSLYLLSKIDVGKLAISIGSLISVYAFFESASMIFSKIESVSFKKNKGSNRIGRIAKSLAALIGSIGLLMIEISILNSIDLKDFSQGIGNLAMLTIGVSLLSAGLIKLTEYLGGFSTSTPKNFGVKNIAMITVAIGALAGLAILLRKYKWTDFTQSFLIIGTLALGMVAINELLSYTNNKTISRKSAITILALSMSISALLVPILALASLGKYAVRPVLLVIGLIMSMAGALWAMSKIKNPLAGGIGFLAIMASVYVVLDKIQQMATKGNVDFGEVSTMFVGLGVSLGGLALALGSLKGVMTTLSGVVKSLSVLSPMGLGKGLLGALGVEALVWIGGKIIGDLLSDLIDKLYTFTGRLEYMSSSLENVKVENFTKLIEVTKKVSEFVGLIPEVKELNKVDALKAALSRISVGLMLSSWGFKITDSDSVKTACGLIKDHIVPAMKAIETINPEFNYDKAASSFTALGSAFDLYGQFVKRATGNLNEANDIIVDGETGKATYNVEELSTFLNDIASLVPDDEVMKSIARFADKEGEEAPGTLLSSWAVGINSIAQAVNNMGVQTEDVDFEAVGNAVDLLNKLKEINDAISRLKISFGLQTMIDQVGGMTKAEISIGFGIDLSPFINGLEGFGFDIASLGNSFNAFGTAINGTVIDETKINYALGVLEKLRVFSERLNENYGLIGATTETINEVAVAGNKKTQHIKSSTSLNFPWLDALLNDNKFERFAGGMADLGTGFNDFALATSVFIGPNKEILDATTVLGNADKGTGILGALAKIGEELSETGGWAQIWTGEKDLGKFATDVGNLGKNLNTFATEAHKINWDDSVWEEHVKPFFDYLKTIGSKDDNWLFNVSDFANGLPRLAEGMSGFVSSLNWYFPKNKLTDEALNNMSYVVTTYFDKLKTAFTGSGELTSNITQFNSALSKLQTLLTAEIETQPVITPVLDLTQITSDVDNLNNLITPNRMFKIRSINSNTQASDLQSRMFTSNGNIIINDDHSDVVSAVNKLGPKIDRLNTSLSGLKIVMNTGVLAGELTGPINKNLGKMASRGQGGS